MTLRIINVPAPAAGTDWTYKIPAQWIVNVVAVYATLTTSQNPSTAVDSSGNGHDATYYNNGGVVWGASGPYGSAPNLAVSIDETSEPTNAGVAHLAATTAFDTTNVTAEAWVYSRSIGRTNCRILSLSHFVSGTPSTRWELLADIAAGGFTLKVWISTTFEVWTTSVIGSNTWIHVAATWDGTNWRAYVNGTLVLTHLGGGPDLVRVNNPVDLGDYGGPFGPISQWHGRLGALAIYSTALAGASIAAHVTAAATSAAAYKASVLGDSPLALWMLDETVTHGSRIANLEITDGTTVVADYPGDAGTGTGSTFTWTWAVNAPGANQSADASTNFVQIPAMTLPGGYTIGTNTPGLGGNDQWSSIAIWWDDAGQGAGGGIGTSAYQNRLLTPDYQGRR